MYIIAYYLLYIINYILHILNKRYTESPCITVTQRVPDFLLLICKTIHRCRSAKSRIGILDILLTLEI